jgi:uncharacterized protein involved in exopolysaccharide biosynthesis/Mrp family chromosome partitioning ATPase
MKKALEQEPKEGFSLQDILYILYKHRWLILIFSLCGFAASTTLYLNRETLYQSKAKLLVRYVLNRNTIDTYQSQLNPTGAPGDQVINTEIQILTSEDIAKAVAESLGPQTIFPDSDEPMVISDAVATILTSLEVAAVPGNVIHLNYSCEDPKLSMLVLNELMKQYAVKHLQIHRSAAAFDLVAKETEDVRKRLSETELELNKLRTASGITTLADATGALAAQRAKTQEDLMRARAELAEQTARIRSMERSIGINPAPREADVGLPDPRNKEIEEEQIPTHVLSEYKTVLDVLGVLQKREIELRLKFKPGNRLITLNQQQLNNYESRRIELASMYPELASQVSSIDGKSKGPQWELIAERTRLASITARVDVYQRHIQEIKEQFNEQYAIGASIDNLERQRQMDDAEYRSLEQNLKNAKIDQTLDPSRMPNITVVQQPSRPIETYDKLTQKIVLGLAGAGLALGLGLAFIIELVFDRKIKRPMEIQARLQLPLLLSIPFIKDGHRRSLMLSDQLQRETLEGHSDLTTTACKQKTSTQEFPHFSHFILPYTETIRDRIIFNFEINNVQHKPKLVAVTGLSEGAGSSTIAAGLAKSFAEINDAKVLLIDLSSFQPQDNPMFGKIPRHSLQGALQMARHQKFRESSQNLYFAGATARRDKNGLNTFSPLHLYELLPHLQASEFDYVIFDMPPIDQTSRTLAMAGLMDKILLVLDAENTSRDTLKWGYSELIKGRADVSCIFNKTRSHAPSWLLGDS